MPDFNRRVDAHPTTGTEGAGPCLHIVGRTFFWPLAAGLAVFQRTFWHRDPDFQVSPSQPVVLQTKGLSV